jgi:hypothetical protein
VSYQDSPPDHFLPTQALTMTTAVQGRRVLPLSAYAFSIFFVKNK